jgi:hypothetical protein
VIAGVLLLLGSCEGESSTDRVPTDGGTPTTRETGDTGLDCARPEVPVLRDQATVLLTGRSGFGIMTDVGPGPDGLVWVGGAGGGYLNNSVSAVAPSTGARLTVTDPEYRGFGEEIAIVRMAGTDAFLAGVAHLRTTAVPPSRDDTDVPLFSLAAGPEQVVADYVAHVVPGPDAGGTNTDLESADLDGDGFDELFVLEGVRSTPSCSSPPPMVACGCWTAPKSDPSGRPTESP